MDRMTKSQSRYQQSTVRAAGIAWACMIALLAFWSVADGPAYATTSAILPENQCESCHVRFASREDSVFTDAHIGLTSGNVH